MVKGIDRLVKDRGFQNHLPEFECQSRPKTVDAVLNQFRVISIFREIKSTATIRGKLSTPSASSNSSHLKVNFHRQLISRDKQRLLYSLTRSIYHVIKLLQFNLQVFVFIS
jgi:hypothetical protein